MFWGSCTTNSKGNKVAIDQRKFQHFRKVIQDTIYGRSGGLTLERKSQLQSLALGWDSRKGERFYCIDGQDIIKPAKTEKNLAHVIGQSNVHQLWITLAPDSQDDIPLALAAVSLLDTLNSFHESHCGQFFELRDHKQELIDWALSGFPIQLIELSEQSELEAISQATAYWGKSPYYEFTSTHTTINPDWRLLAIGASSSDLNQALLDKLQIV